MAGKLNGVYKPVLRSSLEEVLTHATFYEKMDDSSRWLEYRPSIKQWQAKNQGQKGSDVCTGCCTVPAKCLPQECPVGLWFVDDGDDSAGLLPQPDIVISVLTNEVIEITSYHIPSCYDLLLPLLHVMIYPYPCPYPIIPSNQLLPCLLSIIHAYLSGHGRVLRFCQTRSRQDRQ